MRAALVCLLATTSIAFAKPVPEKFPGAQLPDVTRVQDKLGGRSGVVEPSGSIIVVASPTAISIGGKPIVSITNGSVDAAEKEGGVLGNMVPKLAAALPSPTTPEPVKLGIDKSLTYKLLFEMIYSLKKGRSNFQVLVMAGGSVMAARIDLPTAPIKDDLKMVVTASRTEVLVWSISGKEGTLKKPLARFPLDDTKGEVGRQDVAMAVRTELDKVAKRWSAKKKATFGKTVILQMDGGTSMQFVADLMIAVRPSFPNLSLSAGFE